MLLTWVMLLTVAMMSYALPQSDVQVIEKRQTGAQGEQKPVPGGDWPASCVSPYDTHAATNSTTAC